jgi:hypothetical protein
VDKVWEDGEKCGITVTKYVRRREGKGRVKRERERGGRERGRDER